MTLLPFEKEKREILVKREAETNPSFGCFPDKRPVTELLDFGVINLNKPKGPTSHLCSDFVQKTLHIDKAGHGGTLDPGVTGVLPTAIGRATRVVQALLKAGKEYVGILHLHKEVERKDFDKVVTEFTGKIIQLPPVKSAVVRQEREREIYYFDVLEFDGKDVLFRMGCQAGTYVRKVCHDMGIKLKVGAHMSELVRTKAGPFNDSDWVSLQDLEDAYAFWKEENNEKFLRYCIKPVEFAVNHLPKLWVQDSAVDTLCHGASLNAPGIVKLESGIKKNDMVAVMTLKEELIALGNAVMTSEQLMTEQKGFAVKIDKVFMHPGTYKTK